MQLKSYHAGSMRDVMRLVLDELGDEAVIVSTIEDSGGQVRITAALEKPDPDLDSNPHEAPPTPWDNIPDDHGLASVLAYHRVGKDLSDRLIGLAEQAGSDDPSIALAAALDETFRFAPIPNRDFARPVMLVGPAGAGKTATTAKLATRLVFQGLQATVVSADISRAAAAEQLGAFTTILGVELESAATPGELAHVVSRRAAGHAVFIDSFAINPFDGTETARLGEFIASIDADPVLVLAAGLDAAEAADIAVAFADLGAKRMITTRIDQTRRLGSVLSAAHAGGLVIADAGVTPHVAHGLTALNPVSLARLLCRNPEASDTDTDPNTTPVEVSE